MIYIVLSILLIVFDQFTKYLASSYFIKNPIVIFDWFKFIYLENRGAAFGMLAGRQTFFIILTVAVLLLMSVYVYNHRSELRIIEKLGIALFFAGTIGNFIDRVANGYVVDFISVRLFNFYDFPVFNLADCYISIAAVVFIIAVIGEKK